MEKTFISIIFFSILFIISISLILINWNINKRHKKDKEYIEKAMIKFEKVYKSCRTRYEIAIISKWIRDVLTRHNYNYHRTTVEKIAHFREMAEKRIYNNTQ